MDQSGKFFKNRSMPASSVIPVLVYEDVEKAIDWLCHTFGFTERWRAGAHRAQLAFGNGAIVVIGGKTMANEQAHSLLVRVDDLEKHYQHAKQCGAEITAEPTEYPYGEKQYTVTDIGGHSWNFSQSIRDVAPEEWGGTSHKLD